jgi:hypothetical protein
MLYSTAGPHLAAGLFRWCAHGALIHKAAGVARRGCALPARRNSRDFGRLCVHRMPELPAFHRLYCPMVVGRLSQ